MDNNQEKIVYMEVDVVSIANTLSEEAWEEVTKMQPDGNLYEVVVDENGETKRQVVAHWTREFFSMRKCYLSLLNSYARNPMQEHEIDQL